jgi:hypothetical protein
MELRPHKQAIIACHGAAQRAEPDGVAAPAAHLTEQYWGQGTFEDHAEVSPASSSRELHIGIMPVSPLTLPELPLAASVLYSGSGRSELLIQMA